MMSKLVVHQVAYLTVSPLPIGAAELVWEIHCQFFGFPKAPAFLLSLKEDGYFNAEFLADFMQFSEHEGAVRRRNVIDDE